MLSESSTPEPSKPTIPTLTNNNPVNNNKQPALPTDLNESIASEVHGSLPKIPELVHGFEKIRSVPITDLEVVLNEYRHIKTGAPVYHLDCADENRAFSISFRTPRLDSTGVAHIIEHSVLCGSENYPVKEPFLELLKGSFQTFLNASTSQEHTSYPVASTNEQELLNLSKVYLDAVFKPKLSIDTFRREGWRIEQNPETQELQISGIVFNEMKDYVSSPSYAWSKAAFKNLFPNSNYAHESGGLPDQIPQLSYEQFLAFHKTHYVPSNSVAVIYGKLNLLPHLEVLDKYYSAYNDTKPELAFGDSAAISSPKNVSSYYRAGGHASTEKDSIFVMAWAIAKNETNSYMKLNLISEVLGGNAGAILTKELTTSNLGASVINSNFDETPDHYMFYVGLQGVNSKDQSKIEALILTKLEEITNSQIRPEVFDRANIKYGFYKANQLNSEDNGLALAEEVTVSSFESKDPVEALEDDSKYIEIISEARKQPIVQNFIKSELLNNNSRVSLILLPDTSHEDDHSRQHAIIERLKNEYGEPEIRKMLADNLLREARERIPDDLGVLASLPRISLKDIPQEAPESIKSELIGPQILFHHLQSHGAVYAKVAFDSRVLDQHQVALLPLLCDCIHSMGSKSENYSERTNRIGAKVPFIGSTCSYIPSTEGDETKASVNIEVASLANSTQNVWPAISEIIFQTDFHDQSRVSQIVKRKIARLENIIEDDASAVAAMRCRELQSTADWARERTSGLSQLEFLRKASDRISNDFDGFVSELELVRNQLFVKQNAIVSIGAEQKVAQQLKSEIELFINTLPDREVKIKNWSVPIEAKKELIITTSDTNFVSLSAPIANHELNPGHALIAEQIINLDYLWNEIRVLGGAYGAGCGIAVKKVNGMSRVILASVQDPNPEQTIATFRKAGEFLAGAQISNESLENTKKSILASIDAPISESDKAKLAFNNYISNFNHSVDAQLRKDVISALPSDVTAIGNVLIEALKSPSVVVVCSEQTAQEILKNEGDWVLKRVNLSTDCL